MAAPRGTKTTLAFGLVKCPVALYGTTGKPEDAPKWDTAGPNHGYLKTAAELMVEDDDAGDAPLAIEPSEPDAELAAAPSGLFEINGDERTPVDRSDVRRGLRKEDGSFVDLTESIADIEARTKLEEMRVVEFIRTEEVRRDRVRNSYFVASDAPGTAKVLRLLCETMQKNKRVGVVKWTKRSRQSVGVIVPYSAGKSIEVLEMCWHEDVREPPEKVLWPAQVEVSEDEFAVADELVAAMSGKRADSLDVLRDDARGMYRELLARAEAGEMFTMPEAPASSDVEDPVQALRESLADPAVLA
jgi:non-homologous end joining protein Ku